MNRCGFTLMEVIVAALLLAITVGGVLYIFSMEKGTVTWTGRRVQSMNFARQTLEALKDEVGADTWPNSGHLAAGGPTTVDIAAGAFKDKFSGTRSYTVTNIDADGDNTFEDDEYKQVSVTVEWEEPAEPE